MREERSTTEICWPQLCPTPAMSERRWHWLTMRLNAVRTPNNSTQLLQVLPKCFHFRFPQVLHPLNYIHPSIMSCSCLSLVTWGIVRSSSSSSSQTLGTLPELRSAKGTSCSDSSTSSDTCPSPSLSGLRTIALQMFASERRQGVALLILSRRSLVSDRQLSDRISLYFHLLSRP
jgi:hypothetical protein